MSHPMNSGPRREKEKREKGKPCAECEFGPSHHYFGPRGKGEKGRKVRRKEGKKRPNPKPLRGSFGLVLNKPTEFRGKRGGDQEREEAKSIGLPVAVPDAPPQGREGEEREKQKKER